MLIHHDPDEWETVSESYVCSFHQHNPGLPFAACCCSVIQSMRRRDPAIVAKIKADRMREHEDAVLAEAELIKARRGMV